MKFWYNDITGEILSSNKQPDGWFWEEINLDEYIYLSKVIESAPKVVWNLKRKWINFGLASMSQKSE